MNYISTRNNKKEYSFSEAVIKGLSEDGGLFLPEEIPALPAKFFDTIDDMSLTEIAYEISKRFITDIPGDELRLIINEAINFPAPVVRLSDELSVLELFHGPTCAFKDYGARFLAGILSYYLKVENKRCTILVATSGDTGSAVASGFYGKDNIDVAILYPSGKVSRIQEQQLTTFGKNIFAFEIEGTFDDCQSLVKSAFTDEELNKKYFITSANSINIGRLIPQTFYYFNAWKQVKDSGKEIVFTIPSGNLGNLTAGLFAKKMGLPVKYFVSALNSNDVFGKYLKSGLFTPLPSVTTISNAMDVGNPSNLERIRYLYNDHIDLIKNNIHAFSFNDNETREAVKEIFSKFNYIMDPHGAIGYLAAKKDKDISDNNHHYIVLETAHPAKFADETASFIRDKIIMPDCLAVCLNKKKHSVKISKDYKEFKEGLIKTHRL
jgi:threonine synthase